jgi:predicted AAA+ superfamily ATPase
MDFEEFLWATGNNGMMSIIRNAYAKSSIVGADMHRRIMDAFRQYLVVGGMPQAVAMFASTHDLRRVDAEKRNILTLYRADILKHGGASKHKILAVFNAIPGALSRHEWRFSPGNVKKGAGMREYEASFEWLKSAMTVNVAYNATEPNIGLELSSDHSCLKCYLGDTGLLVSMAFSENELSIGEVQQRLLTGRLEVNAGVIYENLVAQMFRAAGQQLHFYASSSASSRSDRMEIDFLMAKSNLTRRHNISPIEVKSSGTYQTKSLDKFRARYGNFLGTPYVLHLKDLKIEDDVAYLPLYMTPFIVTG